MKKLSLALFLCFCCTYLSAQSLFQVKGIVADSTANLKLKNATISILNAKDSTLYKFTRATVNGEFNIQPMRSGNFILLLTYPDYADYVYQFKLDEVNPSFNFGTINMRTKATLLNEVIIKGQAAAIKIKGDTTEFNAGSYTIQPNDKVEDLLKKMPGIQIDKDGKITAQGKTVEKVLVDGEEFFGDDPTLVTKNLRADMIDKVQLFEKSSDQAAFTGVDDGKKTQTINLKLKEDKKSGYFGKVDVGAGTDEFYQAQVMFNKFKAKQKFSLYGTAGNNGKTGLNWDDASKYGGSGGNMEIFDGGIYFSGSGDDIDGFEGQYYGEGIPIARNGGAHYDTKWNADKETINTNYKLGSLGIKANKNVISQNNLPTGIFNNTSEEMSDKYLFRQKLDATYTIKLDTSSNLKVMVDGTLKNSDNVTDYNAISLRGDNSLLNTSKRSVDNHSKDQLFNISAFYTRKLKKPGRNFSINLSEKLSDKNSDGYLKSKNDFYDPSSVLTSSEIIDQYKTNDTKTSSFNSNFTFNEPLSKLLTLVVNYGFSLSSSRSDRKSFNASTPGNYTILDPEYSNDFEATQYTNQGGAMFNYKKLKTVWSFGTKINAVRFNQYEARSNQRYNRSFLNWIPQINYQYKFSNQRSLRFGYYGYTNQPSVDQLQPVKVNTDPLNIPLGNPDLKPSYSSNISLSYNSYKMLSNESIYIGTNFGFTNNQIVNNTTTDLSGKSIRQSINLKEKTPLNFNVYSGVSRKVKALGVDVGLNLNASGSTNYSYINSELNKTTSSRFGPQFRVSRYKDKFELSLNFGPSYNGQEASLQKDRSNKGWGKSGYGNFKIILPKKVTIQADAQYTYTPASASFNTSFEQAIVNASITKSFLKKEELKAMIKVNDLLNQNSGFSRYASANMITQTSYNNINRYFMFSLIWDFNKMGGAPTKN
ncbi:outer membrane beta-barrel family protein [Pedobacter sp. Du54]|uniref:outer membrane beta-barrel family protein n=1 Tax=Pedobacter anseongensis TaxID=3133439 RepID=UPI0030B0AB84